MDTPHHMHPQPTPKKPATGQPAPTAAHPAGDVETHPAGDVEYWKAKAEEYLAGWKRATADYQNLKKEAAAQRASLVAFANLELILALLPVLDHFEQAMQHVPADRTNEPWVVGIRHIHREFADVLKALGVQRMETDGKPFDAERHEAISHEHRDGAAAGTILATAVPGYLYRDTILRPARVTVADGDHPMKGGE